MHQVFLCLSPCQGASSENQKVCFINYSFALLSSQFRESYSCLESGAHCLLRGKNRRSNIFEDGPCTTSLQFDSNSTCSALWALYINLYCKIYYDGSMAWPYYKALNIYVDVSCILLIAIIVVVLERW